MVTKTLNKTSKVDEGKTTTKATTAIPTAAAKAAPVKSAADKTAPVKTAARTTKPAARSTAKKSAAKKEIKVSTTIQYYGNEVAEKDIVANVKKAWRGPGRKVADIKTMELYIKPEDYSVYYVINGVDTGSIPL